MSARLRRTPALRRLEWLLDGLDGKPGWGTDVGRVLAPEFLDRVSPTVFLDTYRRRSKEFAPVSARLMAAGDHDARADIVDAAGRVSVLRCQVEHADPYRIVGTWMAPFVPSGLRPRLPLDFTGQQFPHSAANAQLV
ncbi:MAG TPA: hypothetical protein VFD94_07795, partial [Jatrophihabitans sp.]|nr:hypothetical protein [Jatrophihabitans sp.]